MTAHDNDALSDVLERLGALQELVVEMAEAAAESMGFLDDGRQGHGARLAAYDARVETLRAAHRDRPGALTRLSQRLGLDARAEDILLLALAPMFERRLMRMLSALQGGFGQQRPTIDLALHLFSSDLASRFAALRHFNAGSALIASGALRLHASMAQADRFAQELRVPDWVTRALTGASAFDRPPGAPARRVRPARTFDDVLLDDDVRSTLLATLDTHGKLTLSHGAPRATWVALVGPSGSGKTALAEACAAHLGRDLLMLDGAALSSRLARPAEALAELLAEARATDAVVCIEHSELLLSSPLQGNRDLPVLRDLLAALDDVLLLTTTAPGMLDASVTMRLATRVELEVPVTAIRERIWRSALARIPLPLDDALDVAFLAEKYDFSPGQIASVLRAAQARVLTASASDPSAARITDDDIEHASQAQMQHHLAQLAVKTVTHLRLTDLVLPDDLMGTIRSIIAAVRNRRRIFEEWGFGERMTTGRGLNMLFRGESGTGKTLTAEIIAGELALPIYRVAIPRIVSKYIGETEQNLEKAFREAEVAGAILLFDEADAIFTKRVEVSSSTDRYSNMEVNLLLQEMERFEGVVVLTTNLDAAIDDAFDRRLNYKLDFPFPTADLRAQIWTRLLPDDAPIDLTEDEIEWLADTFELTGGSIKNVAIRAAYTAAELGCSIQAEHLEDACVQEYKELGKLIRSV